MRVIAGKPQNSILCQRLLAKNRRWSFSIQFFNWAGIPAALALTAALVLFPRRGKRRVQTEADGFAGK